MPRLGSGRFGSARPVVDLAVDRCPGISGVSLEGRLFCFWIDEVRSIFIVNFLGKSRLEGMERQLL
jgi:hypothetical protein